MLLYRLCNDRLIFPKITSVFVSVSYQGVCSRKQPGNCVSVPNLLVHNVRLAQAFQIIPSAFGRCWKMVAFPVGESKREYIILKLMYASDVAVKLSLQPRPNINFHFHLKVVFFLLNCCHGWCFIPLMKCSLWPLFLKYQPHSQLARWHLEQADLNLGEVDQWTQPGSFWDHLVILTCLDKTRHQSQTCT